MKNSLVSFDDTAIAFSSKSNSDLNRAYWLFKLIGLNWLVKIAPAFVNTAFALRIPIKGLIRATAFKHFCGGETIEACSETVKELGKFNIGTILDYSVEGKETEADFENALKQTLDCLERAKGEKNIPFSVFKLTGFARFALLEKVNAGSMLTSSEAEEFARVKMRVEKICSTADKYNVPIFIDAEETWIQKVVDDLANEMMVKYNRNKVLVYNTLQLYRTDRLAFLIECHNHAVANNYMLGLKLVRGAYMEKERERAEKMNYPSPIQPHKNATDLEYNESLRFCVEQIDRISVCAGTHNEESSLFLTQLMQQKNIPHDHPHIWFSQLYGMSDHISFNLARQGYNVTKYVPYGPVASVLPYLIRRAQENTSAAGQTGRELYLIQAEKKRRKSVR